MNIYVGNLPFDTDAEGLRRAFERFGHVADTRIIKNRETGKSRGFGFVEMPNKGEAEAAIKGLNLRQLDGRIITVNYARTRFPKLSQVIYESLNQNKGEERKVANNGLLALSPLKANLASTAQLAAWDMANTGWPLGTI